METTVTDVECVLRDYWHRVVNPQGMTLEDLAFELFFEIDGEQIERVALKASTDMSKQVDAAMAEIKECLIELGHITPES